MFLDSNTITNCSPIEENLLRMTSYIFRLFSSVALPSNNYMRLKKTSARAYLPGRHAIKVHHSMIAT
jgi:hypothetical protein